jgi:hypothetical protein
MTSTKTLPVIVTVVTLACWGTPHLSSFAGEAGGVQVIPSSPRPDRETEELRAEANGLRTKVRELETEVDELRKKPRGIEEGTEEPLETRLRWLGPPADIHWLGPPVEKDPRLVDPKEVDRSKMEFISVVAQVDGQSRLDFLGDMVQWQHLRFNLPGCFFIDAPTIINGIEWYPIWPDRYTKGNLVPQRSSAVELPTTLPEKASEYSVEVVEGRGHVRLAYQPSGRWGTLVVVFSDRDHDSAAWYEVKIADASGLTVYWIRALIDGLDYLQIEGNEAHWWHIDAQHPGVLGGQEYPTIINGVEWRPEWPRLTLEEPREGYSSILEGFSPPLPAKELDYSIGVIDGRGSVRIVETPSAENDFTLTVEIYDYPNRAGDYEFEIYYAKAG